MSHTSKHKRETKYNVTFWQLFSIVVIAAVLGGFIYNFAYNNQLFDEINSISFIPAAHPTTTKTTTKAPVKAPVKKTVPYK